MEYCGRSYLFYSCLAHLISSEDARTCALLYTSSSITLDNLSQLEKMMKRLILAALVAVSAILNVHAQTFGEGMTTPSAEELKTILAGNIFTVDRPDGNHWRLEFKSNGYYFANTTSGFADSGEWTVESGKFCVQAKKGTSGCNEARLDKGVLTMKRPNGEIIIYKRKE